MTRSQFLKKLGLGALVCTLAPKMLAEKPKAIDYTYDHYGKPAYMKALKEMQNQLETERIYQETMFGNAFFLFEDADGNRWKADKSGVHKFYIADARDIHLDHINKKII